MKSLAESRKSERVLAKTPSTKILVPSVPDVIAMSRSFLVLKISFTYIKAEPFAGTCSFGDPICNARSVSDW